MCPRTLPLVCPGMKTSPTFLFQESWVESLLPIAIVLTLIEIVINSLYCLLNSTWYNFSDCVCVCVCVCRGSPRGPKGQARPIHIFLKVFCLSSICFICWFSPLKLYFLKVTIVLETFRNTLGNLFHFSSEITEVSRKVSPRPPDSPRPHCEEQAVFEPWKADPVLSRCYFCIIKEDNVNWAI